MDLNLDGKRALVTGSSKGIGEGIAKALGREGATVIVHGRNGVDAERVAQDINARGGRAYTVLGDLTRDDDVDALVATIEGLVGGVDILVNNAGGSGPKETWVETRASSWMPSFDRNVLAAVRAPPGCCRRCGRPSGGVSSTSPAWRP